MTHAFLNSTAGIPLNKANRHGLITGQTGTGKTVSLTRLAEQFSKAGVPVFISDVKGDIAALSRSCPTMFLDVFGQSGKPLKATIAAMGPDLMARALELTDTQAGCLEIAFVFARDTGRRFHTIDDARDLLAMMQENADHINRQYGQISKASIGVIMRALLRLETQGGKAFFGTPRFDVAQLLESWPLSAPKSERKGLVSILQADKLINSPRVYAAFLLRLLSELWERLPEIGDTDQPRLVMFFDEAHLLFSEINPSLLRRIEQTVRLIRSKGVGVYFVTQSPQDVPAAIREQLAFDISHSRAYKIGHAGFNGLTQDGKPVVHGVVKVELPDCPLGALNDDERANVMPEPAAPEIERPKWARLGKAEIILLAVLLIAAGLAISGLLWLWFIGPMGKAAAIALSLFVAALIAGG